MSIAMYTKVVSDTPLLIVRCNGLLHVTNYKDGVTRPPQPVPCNCPVP